MKSLEKHAGGAGLKPLARNAMAVAAVGVAFALRKALAGYFGEGLAYITFFPAVMLAATLGGVRTGLLATALSALLTAFWIVAPIDGPDAVGLAMFCGMGVFISAVVGMYRRALGKFARSEREITVEFLRLMNETAGTAELLKAAATFFQEKSGCEAVGIRIKEGDDYPYFEARGFPKEFILLENRLCARDAAGNVIRDSTGNPVIECMCGNVICGRVNARKPFFTEGGSFWANDTTRLLATTTDEDRQTRTRNRCNGEGYESVALIPLRAGAGRLGLLQLNDRRKGMFNPHTIALWERLAGYLAVAVAKARAEEALREDVIQRKRAEERIATVARLYAVLSQVNEAIVRTRDEQSLCGEACRIIAEVGGFPLVWIGLVKQREVVPAAWSGPAGDYLREIKIELDGELGRGPTGTCIREDRAVVNDDFDTNPSAAPWRDAALRHGIRASASFPLSRRGNVVGALMLYASKPAAFDPEQVKLLEALCADVSYALGAFEQERLRNEAERALRESERMQRLLAEVGDLVVKAPKVDGLIAAVGEWVAKSFAVSRCGFSVVDQEAGSVTITQDYHSGLDSITGVFPFPEYRARWREEGLVDRPEVIEDAASNPRTAAVYERSFAPIQVRAYLSVSLHREGKWVADFWAAHHEARSWTAGEIEAMQLIADRIWAIVERKGAEEALREANARLLDADRRKDEFLAVLSHELRNPLAPIKNSLYILDRAAPGSDQADRAKTVIDRQVGQLVHLVDDLLDVTRITRGKIQLQRQRLELNDLVRHAVEDYRSQFDRAEVRLDFEPATAPVSLNADESRIAQIVGNLLQNAAKFTGRGGRVSVTVSTEAGAKQAVIRVADTGVGMPPKMIERLFQPFVQADQTLDRSKGGLGLGLALVKGLAELHGGEVSANSEGLGKGSEFVVRLPITLEEGTEPEQAHVGPRGIRRRVLIVEDNVDAAESLRVALEFGKHEIEVAYTGPEGLAKAREFRPEVMLCDIGLPGMDGFEVARAIRSDGSIKGVFLVALTGYALSEDLKRAAEAGFDRHLAKPPSLEQLDELLASIPIAVKTGD